MVVLGGSASWSGVVSRVEAGGWLFRVGARILVAFFRGLGSGDSCFGGIRGLDWRFSAGWGRGIVVSGEFAGWIEFFRGLKRGDGCFEVVRGF